ncbi:MAG: hypothetical protein AB7G12_12660 [Thermoanaerobaculia bacterium]
MILEGIGTAALVGTFAFIVRIERHAARTNTLLEGLGKFQDRTEAKLAEHDRTIALLKPLVKRPA